MTLFLITGVGFIVAGFAAMIRIRQEIRNRARDMTDLNKLEKLMVKIGIFSMLYVLPALTVIGCSVYEKTVLDEWSHSSYTSFCSNGAADLAESKTLVADEAYHRSAAPHRTMTREASKQFLQAMNQLQGQQQHEMVGEAPMTCLNSWLQTHSRPKVDVYILKIFMTLIVGITSGMWVWSRKTCATWQRRVPCCNRFCICCRILSGPTGAKTLVQYPPQPSSAAAVGVPLLAGQGQQLQQSAALPAHPQYVGTQQSQRSHLQQASTSSSYHRHQNRHPTAGSSCTNAVPLQTFSNGVAYGVGAGGFPSTASSEASAKI